MARYLTYNDLDAIAGRVFRAYSRLPEVQAAGQLLYVDPALLLNSLLGLTIEFRHLSAQRTMQTERMPGAFSATGTPKATEPGRNGRSTG